MKKYAIYYPSPDYETRKIVHWHLKEDGTYSDKLEDARVFKAEKWLEVITVLLQIFQIILSKNAKTHRFKEIK